MPSFTASPANWTNSSDANFRAWGSYLSARFSAVGLIQTADTGQINWTTITTPAGVNTYQGYEVWRFADALQASAPVFYRIQYGENDTADTPGIRIQFGAGSDGAGNLTGNLSAVYDAGGQVQAGVSTVVGSGSTNRFVIAAGWTSFIGLCFSFERSKDSTGADTTEAVLFFSHGPSSSGSGTTTAQNITVWSTTLGILGTLETTFGALFAAGTSMSFGSQTMVSPIFHNKGVFMNPGMNMVGYYTANITPGGTASIYMYGAARTYYALASTVLATSSAFRGNGGGTESMAIRYD